MNSWPIFIVMSLVAFMFYMQFSDDFKEKSTKSDYQINVHNDTIWLYDGSRLVGKVLNTWDSPLDSLILKDNN